MNTVNKPVQPRRTSTKEAGDRNIPAPVKEFRPYVNQNINVMAILADHHPMNGEDYAIQLFYRSKENRRNPFFTCTEKKMESDNETAHITVNSNRYQVNIRTGQINIEH